MYQKKRNFTSIFICALLVFLMIFSLFYIAREENHDCTGEDCPICTCLHQAEQTVKTIGSSTVSACFILSAFILLFLLPVQWSDYRVFPSLISQKVRLNN